MLTEKPPLSLVDEALIPIDLPLGMGQELASLVRVVEQRPVDARCVALEDGQLPKRRQHPVGFTLSDALNQVVDNLQIAPVRENDGELILRGLEDAEGRVRGTIDYLNVSHSVTFVGER